MKQLNALYFRCIDVSSLGANCTQMAIDDSDHFASLANHGQTAIVSHTCAVDAHPAVIRTCTRPVVSTVIEPLLMYLLPAGMGQTLTLGLSAVMKREPHSAMTCPSLFSQVLPTSSLHA